jgi:AbrB family looped-hinge helix DNA binding protein
MATDENETTVNESWAVTIPAAVRKGLDLEPGDRLRWAVEGDGRLIAEVVRERHGAAGRLEPVDMGETDAVEATDAYDWS